METVGFGVIALGLLAFATISERSQSFIITPPMVFVAFGLGIGAHGLGLVDLEFEGHLVHTIAELTLVVVLFTDAARIDFRRLFSDHDIPVRILVIGMPLTILLGIFLAVPLFPGFSIWEAALLAAILAPTDAALGQAVVSSPKVPVRIRQALNVESGLNDGIALPIIVLFLCFANMEHATDNETPWLLFGILQVTLGPLAGAVIGFGGGKAVEWSCERGWMSESFQGFSALAVALLAFSVSESIGGNGFIAAFTAGLTLGNTSRGVSKFLLEFAEAEGQLLTLFVFMVFGAAMVPQLFGAFTIEMVLFAVLALTVMRMGPVAVSLIGLGLKWPTVLFVGWFGPRGLASILFGLLVLEVHGVQMREEIMLATILTVLLSVLAHGMSAAPLSALYGASQSAVADKSRSAEHRKVKELPTRIGGSRS